MFPTLIKIGPLTLHTYGLMIALGIFFGLRYLLSHASRQGIAQEKVLDIALYAVVAGIVGARLAYVLLNLQEYSVRPLSILKIWEGGLVFYGGFIAGTIAVLVYLYVHRGIRVWVLADLFAPAIALAHFFGRLGCFFAGCCYGDTCRLPWAVTFKHPDALAPLGVPLHPVQLYEAFGNLALFIVLHRYNGRPHRPGTTFGLYLLIYGIMRFIVEFFRADDRGGFAAGLSPSQLTAVGLVIIAMILLWIRKKYE